VEPGTTFSLFYRVINIREGFSVPLGLRGTLIRVQKAAKQEDNLYDVVFDEAFTGGLALRCSAGRGYRLPGSALINLSFKTGRVVEVGAGAGRSAWAGQGQVKPQAMVRPYEEGKEGAGGGGRPGVWDQRAAGAVTGVPPRR
jgi:5'-3' exoribonuclease 1